MKAKDLTERTDDALRELEKSIQNDIFQAKFKNYTNRLNDTASVRRLRRDLARVKTILTQRSAAATEGK
jgi:large subunit ribosomal protein L29